MRLKQLAAVMMGTVLIVGSLPYTTLAKEDQDNKKGAYSTKDESIYGKLEADGTLKNMYVVNTFHDTKPGVITDYGDYTNVRNLSNLTDIKQKEDHQVRFQAEKGDDHFYYQGDIDNQALPWDIDITYKLDGQEIAADDLAGKDGSFELQIETSGNDDADAAFFENYMLQISLTLDPVHFEAIQAPDATKAKAGKDTILTFTVLPEKEKTFVVSADVTDLEMDPIELSATPASMPIDDPDLDDVKGDMQSLADAIKKIDSGVGDLNSGISELNDGTTDLSEGSSSYLSGIQQLDQSSDELIAGSSEINGALGEVSDAMEGAPDEAPDLSEFKQLPDGMRALADGLYESADGLNELRDNYETAYNELNDAMDGIPGGDISEADIKELLGSDVDQEVVQQLIDSYQAAQKAKGTYQAVQEAFEAVTGTLGDVADSLKEMADNADATATQIENGLADMDGLDELGNLQSSLSAFSSQYQSFHEGLVEYTGGVSELASNYQSIDSGIDELSAGTESLENGVGDLQEGTQKLRDKTSDLPGEMQSEVDDMMEEFDASDFDPISFVSDENKDIDVVQFAMQTEPIEVEEIEETEETKEEKGFWERFMDLFR